MTGPLLVATANPGKVRELATLLRGIAVCGLGRVGIGDLDEPTDDYVLNACAKARQASARSGLPALADDSGLDVDALGGAPGAFSARFSGRHGDDGAHRQLLLARMAGVGVARRGARFRCVLALADDAGPLGARVLWVHAACEGRIAWEPRGEGGFGYDPLFVPAGGDRTMAELAFEEKQRLSHRGRAVRAFLPLLQAYLRGVARRGDGARELPYRGVQ